MFLSKLNKIPLAIIQPLYHYTCTISPSIKLSRIKFRSSLRMGFTNLAKGTMLKRHIISLLYQFLLYNLFDI